MVHYVRKAYGLEPEAAGHVASTVWKQRQMRDDVQLPFSFLISPWDAAAPLR